MTPKHIVKLRQDLGLTQQQLADMIGAYQRTVPRWETGVNEPKGANLKALLDLWKKAYPPSPFLTKKRNRDSALTTRRWNNKKEKLKEARKEQMQRFDQSETGKAIKAIVERVNKAKQEPKK
jgi:predicted transcriptional regulator